MPDYTKDARPKTFIFRIGSDGKTPVLVKTLLGLPYGVPSIGTTVNIPEYGQATCDHIQKSGSGSNETIVEVSFTLK